MTFSKVLILGAGGMLGHDLAALFSGARLCGHEDLDITDEAAVKAYIRDAKPDLVINAAAYTNVDGCEDEPETAFAVNGDAPGYIAAACREVGAVLVHYSTDYVFDGSETEYVEADEPNPINVYGASKLRGEQKITENMDDFRIIRTSWLFGRHGKNFVETIRHISQTNETVRIVIDQVGKPTYTMDLAQKTAEIAECPRGIYHATNDGVCSWYEFARAFVPNVVPCKSSEFPQKAKRPAYSVLVNTKTSPMRPWKEALEDYLRPTVKVPMKGIILAGGTGSRLYPLTKVTNKHLLPVYDKPMIYYPLQTLVAAGIKDIMIVSGRGHVGHFLELLGSGKDLGVRLTYEIQEGAGGIAQALGLAESWAGTDNVAVILGDNIFQDDIRKDIESFESGAKIFLKEVPDAQRFGVAEVKGSRVIGIEEKPKVPKSNLAVTGLYLYDAGVFEIIRTLKPSGRGELEITDVNNAYIRRSAMEFSVLEGFWSDAGTFESLLRASVMVQSHGVWQGTAGNFSPELADCPSKAIDGGNNS
ncbi:dTDP-4-dehydrorhamnose reductase [Methanoculleus sp. FWC-SCC3]|uniref:glucose-1-phosphate thymidylyltransferase n=2 Tax=Methanoculleus methanifontis TaxID=2584086 RepID=A0ABT8M4P8_9EURY|nr:dTDP-4-dehydrorhamnose reductase [Methanoculleus sp. FWC-SCC3]